MSHTGHTLPSALRCSDGSCTVALWAYDPVTIDELQVLQVGVGFKLLR